MEYYDNGIVNTTFDLAQNWVMLSFNKYVPSNGSTENATKFAWGIKGGVGAGLSGFSTYYQFNIGGGLVFGVK